MVLVTSLRWAVLISSVRKSLLLFVSVLVLVNSLFFITYVLLVLTPGTSFWAIVLHLILVTLASFVISLLATVFFARFVTGPLHVIGDFLQGLRPGVRYKKLENSRNDEIGELAHVANKLAERINEDFHQLSIEKDSLDLVLSRIGDGIFVLDGEGVIRSINPSAENIFGISAKTGQGISFIEAVRDYELEKPVRQCLKTKKPQQEYLDLRNRGLYLGMIVTPLATEPGCLVLVQDLSRLKKLEIIRKDFIANVSHELRTPVSSIKLLSETLENGALEDPAVSLKFLKQINQEAGKLEGIVQGMTTLAQIESGEGRLKKKPVDICKLAGQAAERLREMADRNGQELEVILPGNEVMVMADASQLEQVIYNITHNAIKFTPHGGKVKIQVTCDGLQVVVSISDTGCGIDPADLERIFERFYKVDKSRNSRGSGLGLAISRHIIEAHGGHIWAESEPNRGSRVSFSLPC